MTSRTGEADPHKNLLVWPVPIPNEIRALFTNVFPDVFQLIKYICQVLTKTDTFHLIIPLDGLKYLLKDLVHQFAQVVHIDIVCDSISELRRVKSCFLFGYEKIKFCAIRNILKLWDRFVLDQTLVSSNSINETIKTAIISLIQARIAAKQSSTSSLRLQIAKQLTITPFYGFSVKNPGDFASSYVCPCCQLVYRLAYQLGCGHHQCGICLNIQKKCAICFRDILPDNVTVDENLQMEMRDLRTHCSYCDHAQSLGEYELHLQENHLELLTRFIGDHEVDEDMMVMSMNGTCVWMIPHFEQLKVDAISGLRKSIYSPPFYLFPNGYQMCLRLFANGNGDGKGTHMSLFFVIMRGDYDDQLQWPFKYQATFSLIDQSRMDEGQHHMSQSRWPSSNIECFEQPSLGMNVGYGISKFIPLNLFQIHPDRYIKNGTTYIQFTIDLSAGSMMNGTGESPHDEEHVDTTEYNIPDLICVSGDCNNSSMSK